MKTALCSRCKERKTVSMFGKNKGRNNGLQAYCKACRRAHDKERPGYTKRYGLSRDDIEDMLIKQNHSCLICGVHADVAPKVGAHRSHIGLVVDHNHQTGAVRGLLCQYCNLGIGQLKDDADIVLRAYQYLKHHKI